MARFRTSVMFDLDIVAAADRYILDENQRHRREGNSSELDRSDLVNAALRAYEPLAAYIGQNSPGDGRDRL